MVNQEIIERLRAGGVIVNEELFARQFMAEIQGMGLVDYPVPPQNVEMESANLARYVALGLKVGAITLGLAIADGSHALVLGDLGVFLASWGGAALGSTSRELVVSCRDVLVG